jgi:type IX secretion system PorP/SprF family membrane protein
MKRYLTIFSASVLLGLSVNSNAQDIHFSQFYENAILRNPALCGIFSDEYKIGIDYRNQWSTVATPFKTTMISGETRILVNREIGDYLSFGLVMTYDQAGSIDFKSQQVYGAVSYNKALEDEHNSYLSVGFTGGYIGRNVNQSLMTFSSQWVNSAYNASNATGERYTYKNLSNYDMGAGVSLNSSFDLYGRYNYYLGASLYHLNSPTMIFSGGDVLVKLPMKWQFAAGFHCPLGEQFGLSFHSNVSMQQSYKEYIGGLLFSWRNLPPGMPSTFTFHFGAMYRYEDAFIPTFKFDYQNLSFGFSYDVNNSSLSTGAPGASSTEVTLYIRGNYLHRKDPRDPIMCPRFEDPANSFYR